MRRVALAIVLLACACNVLTGASELDPTLEEGCVGGRCLPEGGRSDGSSDDGALVSDAPKDGDDLTPGGFLDGTYGTGGVAKSTLLSEVLAVAVDGVGRAHVVGVTANQLAVVRFTPDGQVDTTFGTTGRLSIATNIVIGGTTQQNFLDPNPVDGGAPIPRFERYLYAARIKDGALDPGFATGGKYRPNPAVNGEGARAVTIGPNDTILLAGSGPSSAFTVWRLTESGNADPAFGQGGRAVVSVPNAAPAVAMVRSGTSILTAGGSGGDFAVAQLDEVGTPVAGFGADGGVAIAKPSDGTDEVRAVAAFADGRVVVAGVKPGSGVRTTVFAIARLGTDGAVDTTFGTMGVASFDFEAGGTWKGIDEELHGVVVDSRGRVVVAGYVTERPQMGPGVHRTVLARLREDGSLDPLFANGGKMSFTDSPDSRLRGTALTRATSGALVVAGAVEGNGIFVARIVP
jgi:uncharacterized delta-60 repeat protein